MSEKTTADFLLEIGTEEMPARYVNLAIERYQEIFAGFFNENGLSFDEFTTYATPRRLGFLFKALSLRQSDRTEEVRGPSLKAGKNATGEWTQAAIGFARSQGIAVDALIMRETSSGPYLFAVKHSVGQATKDLLEAQLPSLIGSADWPKSMRWGTVEMRFIRPIRWLVALFDGEVVPFTVAGITSDSVSYGHRTLAPQAIKVTVAGDYESALEQVHVLASVERRRVMIANQVNQLASANGLTAQIDEDLLDEVTQLVEYPTAFLGSFDESFLAIPERVIITSMKENQRYFPVFHANGSLAPRFIGVRNGGDNNLAQVVKGNEKVLSARLADAKFFFAEDRKVTLEDLQTKLKTMTYQDALGSVADRERRIADMASELAKALGTSDEVSKQVTTAAKYSKFDLATHMVYEFPELEGYMGRIYANLLLNDEAVGQAIEEQYFPKGAGAPIAASLPGKIVAIADKMERLIGGFATLGMPTGSQDPYGLRRAAIGIVRTLAEGEIELSLDGMVDIAIEVMNQDPTVQASFDAQLRQDVLAFLVTRFKTWLIDKGLPGDVAEGLVVVRPYVVFEVTTIADGVAEQLAQGGFAKLVELSKRVRNILVKQSIPTITLGIDQWEEAAERVLYETVLGVQKRAKEALEARDAVLALNSMLELEEPIHSFFNEVMVMDEREEVRTRRLALLLSVQNTLSMVLDLSQIVIAQ